MRIWQAEMTLLQDRHSVKLAFCALGKQLILIWLQAQLLRGCQAAHAVAERHKHAVLLHSSHKAMRACARLGRLLHKQHSQLVDLWTSVAGDLPYGQLCCLPCDNSAAAQDRPQQDSYNIVQLW